MILNGIVISLSVLLSLIIGGVVGYLVSAERQRRAGGGKDAAELRDELNDYKAQVNDHFRTTAELFHGVTSQYRELYKHLASSADTLCDASQLEDQLAHLSAGLLAEPLEGETAPIDDAEEQPDEIIAASDEQESGVEAEEDEEPVGEEGRLDEIASASDEPESGQEVEEEDTLVDEEEQREEITAASEQQDLGADVEGEAAPIDDENRLDDIMRAKDQQDPSLQSKTVH